jgi:3-deoxy-manno-octulosonate cytidylyltransferase (CMP-KDO synthetase)
LKVLNRIDKSMKAVAIIPARMESSRFPGKPLAQIHGMPMIGHCYYRTRMCSDLIDTYVATCNQEIVDYIESIGGKAIMTKSTHERATDRTAEAMIKIEQELGYDLDVVVMVQGDEPMTTPSMITLALQPFYQDSSVNVVNLMKEMDTYEEFEDANEVKVVVDKNGDAIYFSREPIPSRKKGIIDGPMLKQVCIIPFRREYLLKFNDMEETELERIESVDMLRIIENGGKVRMVYSDTPSFSVDTEADLKNVVSKMTNDKLMNTYLIK